MYYGCPEIIRASNPEQSPWPINITNNQAVSFRAKNPAPNVKAEQKPAERQKQTDENRGKKSQIKALTWGFFYDIPPVVVNY
jgi:hypothetical protein